MPLYCMKIGIEPKSDIFGGIWNELMIIRYFAEYLYSESFLIVLHIYQIYSWSLKFTLVSNPSRAVNK